MPYSSAYALKGSHYPGPREATRIRPFQGWTLLGRVFRERCTRLLYRSPAGMKLVILP
jgi:hypothetical protein